MSLVCKITKRTNQLLIIHKLRLITSFCLFNINVSWEYLSPASSFLQFWSGNELICKYKPNRTIQQQMWIFLHQAEPDPTSLIPMDLEFHIPLEVSPGVIHEVLGLTGQGKGKEGEREAGIETIEEQGPVIIYSQFLEDPREHPSQVKDFTLTKQKGATCKWKAMESFIPRLGMNPCPCILFPP